MKNVIIVSTHFIHPILGGNIETTMKEFDIIDGASAEEYYRKEEAKTKGNKDVMNVTIDIVQKE